MNSEQFQQPKPDSKNYSDLIHDIEKGIIKVPKFQREFVWSLDKTAELLDSILKGYPIGTFILWQTDERINDIKNIGNLELPETPEGSKVQYVLDGQQRITSLYAARLGAEIQKTGEKRITDYKRIVVNLDEELGKNDDQIITAEPTGDKHISLSDVLNFNYRKIKELEERFNKDELDLIYSYSKAFEKYDFSIVVLRKEDIDSAIEVFTRINTGGQTLTLFEIMSAKTYDQELGFDMQAKWEGFIEELKETKYEGVSNTVVLTLLSLILSPIKECKRKTILKLSKEEIIENWENAITALKESIDYFRTTYRIPVSQLLPYDLLLVPFAYFFFHKKDKPSPEQRKYLEEYFWRMSLSSRYSSSTETRLAQDIKRIDQILKNKRPEYSDIKVNLDSPQTLIDTNFRASNSYCKAILCLLAYQEPKDFQDNGKINLDNSWLRVANSKNYHHFFPKKHLEKKGVENSNSLVNITFVSDRLNKRKIGASAPSNYVNAFKEENPDIKKSLNSHFIELSFGIDSDDYREFLAARAKRIYDELKARIDLNHRKPPNEEIQELVAAGESDIIEYKSTLRHDLRTGSVNKKLEYVVAKTIVAFLNTNGGDLLIGIDDKQNAIGLSRDLQTLDNVDKFGRHLSSLIKKYIGADYSKHVRWTFHDYDDVQICRIRVDKSSKLAFTKIDGKQECFVRSGPSSQPLSREEQSSYDKELRRD